MSEQSVNNESGNNTRVSQASATNGATFQDIASQEPFTNFDDITNHTNVANDALHKVNCEENHLRDQRCKRCLLSTRVGTMKDGEALNYENDDDVVRAADKTLTCKTTIMHRLFLVPGKTCLFFRLPLVYLIFPIYHLLLCLHRIVF